MNQSKVIVAHLGARKHYQEPIFFHQWGVLDKFYTDFYAKNNLVSRFLRSPLIYAKLPSQIKRMLDRYNPALDGAVVIDFPLFGIKYAKALKNHRTEDVNDLYMTAGQKFNELIINNGLGQANIVYGFNSASLELFKFAKLSNLKCILDQTIAVSSLEFKLMTEEEQQWPNWSIKPFKITDSMRRKAERTREEQEIADHIVCGSNFVKSSLISDGISPGKVTVVSLGSVKETKGIVSLKELKNKHSKEQTEKQLKVLFAGSVGLRKGIPYLLEALEIIKDQGISFICKIAGNIDINQVKIVKYQNLCEFLGRVPRTEMSRLYQWADVFVLPSICEGSAMVTYEALLWGLPIITTPNSGSIVRDNIDGFIVPIRDSQAIANSLIKIFDDPTKYSNPVERQNYLRSVQKEAEEKLKTLIIH